MARSKKDGRRQGAHHTRETWSKRCKKVNGFRMSRYIKQHTHHIERRITKRDIVREMEMDRLSVMLLAEQDRIKEAWDDLFALLKEE